MIYTNEESYKIIGEFLSRVNQIEFLVNTSLEQIIATLSKNNTEFSMEINYALDNLNSQSIRSRISSIILLVIITKPKSEIRDQAIRIYRDIYKKYNKEFRDYRDFVAHNPFLKGVGKIVSAKRYGSAIFNSVTITEIPRNLI